MVLRFSYQNINTKLCKRQNNVSTYVFILKRFSMNKCNIISVVDHNKIYYRYVYKILFYYTKKKDGVYNKNNVNKYYYDLKKDNFSIF